MKSLYVTLILILTYSTAAAQAPAPTRAQYEAAQNFTYDRSIIYMFYNSTNCNNCNKAMDMFEEVYNKYYSDIYYLYKINYKTEYLEYNYTKTYNLFKPLEIVLAKVQDGKAFGIQKMENIQYNVNSKIQFERMVRTQIDRFLGQ